MWTQWSTDIILYFHILWAFLLKGDIEIGLKNIYTVQSGQWCNNGAASSSSMKANSECYIIRS